MPIKKLKPPTREEAQAKQERLHTYFCQHWHEHLPFDQDRMAHQLGMVRIASGKIST